MVELEFVLNLVELVEFFLHVFVQFHQAGTLFSLVRVLVWHCHVDFGPNGISQVSDVHHLILNVLILVPLGCSIFVTQDWVKRR